MLNTILTVIVVAFLIYIVGQQVYYMIQRKRVGTQLEEEDFNAGMRKAQIIDLREAKYFNSGHILGARNIPYSQLKQRYNEIRPDLPVYLYDQGRTLSTRGAILLHRKGYKQIFWLKRGYQSWDGKIKRKKY